MTVNKNGDNMYVCHNTFNSYLRCWEEEKEKERKAIQEKKKKK